MATQSEEHEVPTQVIFLVAACAVFGFSVVVVEEPLLLVLGLGLLFGAQVVRHATVGALLVEAMLLSSVLMLSVLALVLRPATLLGPTHLVLDLAPPVAMIALATLVALWRENWTPRRAWMLGLASAAVIAGTGLAHILFSTGFGIDVLHLHHQAGEALFSGESLHGPAVTVFDGRPGAPDGAVITGYPYPPFSGLVYGGAALLLGDARYASLLAWTGLLVLLTAEASRRSRLATLVVLLVAALPGWPLVLRAAWTEPVAVFFIALALWGWWRPALSAVALGLALSTKQYFAVAGPLVVFAGRRTVGWKAVVLGVIACTLGIGAWFGPRLMFDATVMFLVHSPPRPGMNLAGLLVNYGVTWVPPSFVALGVPILVGLWTVRSAVDQRGFAVSLGLPMAAFFLLTPHSGPNYWLVSFGLAGIGAIYALPQERG